MKIIATSDWHLGNMFHGNNCLPEHRHFLRWLLQQIEEQQPDALLVAGDVFDNGNPSSEAQSAYYEFLAQAGEHCPDMLIIITAGNMGMGAFNKLTAHGISVVRGCHGNIEEVLKAYLDGSISDSAESCSHHDCGDHEEKSVFIIPKI